MAPVMEPPPEEGDDVWQALEDIFNEFDDGDIVDVTKLSDEALRNQFNNLTEQIKARREVLQPRTDEGRELHSLRAAMSVELRQRGLL